MSAGARHAAKSGRRPHPVGKSGVEDLHEHGADIVAHPFVEDFAEEVAPLLWRDGEICHFALRFVCRSQLSAIAVGQKPLDDGGELQVAAPHVAEEAVEIQGIVSFKIIHYRHGIPFHTVAFEQMYASHHLLPRWRAPLHPSKFIVKLLGPVNADAHEPMVSSEESAPIVVQQRAVRLNAVVDDVFACILFL